MTVTPGQAIAFVREHGVVLASGKGPVPCLAEVIVGGPIKGSWWAHPQGRQIFGIFQKIYASPDILVCRLVGGKVTFIHRRLWPALARLADSLTSAQLAQVHEEHTASGRHITKDVAFPGWVPRDVLDAAKGLSEQEARAALGEEVMLAAATPRRSRPK
jgi:hypothetical protein